MSYPAALCLAALCAVGCATEPATAAPEPIRLQVGTHAIRLVAPPDWQHLDHGREHRFERGFQQLSLADLGPATQAARIEILQDAMRLRRNDRLDDARTRIAELALEPRIEGRERQKALSAAWTVLNRIGRKDRPPAEREIDDAFELVLEELRGLPDVDPEELAGASLEKLDHNERRNIASTERLSIDGKPAWQIDTWERLNHTGRRRHVLLILDGHLLAVRMENGTFAEMQPAFDALVASIVIETDPA